MQVSGIPLDLSPLLHHCVFRSEERVATHDLVTQAFSDHGLHWGLGAIDTSMFKAAVRYLQIYMLQYGAEVEIRPRPFDGFVLVHTSLAGVAEIEADGRPFSVRPGAAVVVAPQRNLHMRWQQGSRQFILKIPHSLLGRSPAFPDAIGRPLTQPLLPIVGAQAVQWQLLMQTLLNVLLLPQEGPAHAGWIEHLERNIALFITSRADTASSTGIVIDDAKFSPLVAGAPRRLDALVAYMRANLCGPVSLEAMSRANGMSVRALNDLCQRHHGLPPMTVLRNLRLDAARARLSDDQRASVTEVAFEFGFGHLGRFSAYYRNRFGELPRLTNGYLQDRASTR